MCWILGLHSLVAAVLDACGDKVIRLQFEHVKWEGFHFYDLIFPLFLFIAGVSLSIALPKHLAREGLAATVRHLIVRALVLFIIGVIYSGGFQKGIDQVRWLGVLQRIALGSCIAGLLSLFLSLRALVVTVVSLLVGYWALLTFVPVPGGKMGSYAEGANLTNYIDRIALPGRRYDGDHDPEGILSTLPAIATALIGLLAGRWMTGGAPDSRKVTRLLAAGVVMLVVGWLWHLQFHVIKKLWTSSFVLVAGGWSAILFATFYWLVDVRQSRWWIAPFVWVGANPVFLYVCSGLGYFRILTERITGPGVSDRPWLPAAVGFALVLLTARFLYKRSIFIRV